MNRKFMNFTSVSLALLMSVSCFAPYVPTSVYASESESVQVSTETGDTSSETIQIDTAEKSVTSSVSVGEAADSNIVVDNTDGYSVGDAIPVHVKASNTGKEDVKFRVYFWDYDKELPKDKTTWAEKLKTVCSDVQISEFKDKNPISVKLTKDKDSQKADVTFAQETDEKTKDVTARYLSLTLPAGTTLDTVFHVTSDSAETVTVVPVSDSEFGDATQITWNKKDVVVESDEKKENGSEDIKIGTSDINFEPVPDENKDITVEGNESEKSEETSSEKSSESETEKKKDSDTGIVDISSDIEKVDEASKDDSDVNASESEEDTKTSTEVSTETETTADSEAESETETDTKTEDDTEVSTDSKSDVVLDTETDSETETSSTEEEHFLDAVDGAEELNASDFSSARLVVLTSDENVIVDKEHLIGSYDNLYLLQYKSAEQAMNAYVYYQTHADAVEPDMTLDAADDEDVTGDGVAELSVTEEANPISSLEDVTDSEDAQKADKVIALIDTGASESSNVIDRVSLIDDVLAGNGHGDKMVEAIVSQNADAKILSIRTMGNDGRGTVSSVVAGMEYAINQNVSIINLSMYAKSNLSNSVIASEIQKAVDAGIEVVGAAGNDGADAKDYMPGSVESAWIIGAADNTGSRLDTSNYGDTVDYNVVADSTSEAAAKFSGYVSENGTDAIAVNEGVIFTTDYVPSDKPSTDNGDSDNKGTDADNGIEVVPGEDDEIESIDGYPDANSTTLVHEKVWTKDTWYDFASYNPYGDAVTMECLTEFEKPTYKDGDTVEGEYLYKLKDKPEYQWGLNVVFTFIDDRDMATIHSDKSLTLMPSMVNQERNAGYIGIVPETTDETVDGGKYTALLGDEDFTLEGLLLPYNPNTFKVNEISDDGGFDINKVGSYTVMYKMSYFMYFDYTWNVQVQVDVVDPATLEPGLYLTSKESTLALTRKSDNQYGGYGNLFKLDDSETDFIVSCIDKDYELGVVSSNDAVSVDDICTIKDNDDNTKLLSVKLPETLPEGATILSVERPGYVSAKSFMGGGWKTQDYTEGELEGLTEKEFNKFEDAVSGESDEDADEYMNVAAGWTQVGTTKYVSAKMVSGDANVTNYGWVSHFPGANYGTVLASNYSKQIISAVHSVDSSYDVDAAYIKNFGFSCASGHDYMALPANTTFNCTISVQVQKNGDSVRVRLSMYYEGGSDSQGNYQDFYGSTIISKVDTGIKFRVYKRLAGAGFSNSTARIGKLSTTFGIYTNAACDRKHLEAAVRISVPDEENLSAYAETDGLDPGKYWVKETRRINGCVYNEDIYPIELKETTKSPAKLKDVLIGDPKNFPSITNDGKNNYVYNKPFTFTGELFRKMCGTNKDNASPVAGAVFRVEYSSDPEDTKVSGDSFSKADTHYTWYFKSGSDGKVVYDKAHLVPEWTDSKNKKHKSDALITYYDNPALPIGYLRVKEVEAPAKYDMNTNTFYFRIVAVKDEKSQYSIQKCKILYQEYINKEWKANWNDKGGYSWEETAANPSKDEPGANRGIIFNKLRNVKVTVKKASKATSDIMGLSAYSLAGGKFEVWTAKTGGSRVTMYEDEANTKSVTQFVTDDKGNTPTYYIPVTKTTTYWVREVVAIPGHEIQEPISFTVTLPQDAGTTKTVNFTGDHADMYTYVNVDAIVEKLSHKGQPVKDIVFKAQLYDGNKADASKLKKTWYLKSDAEGKVKLGTQYLADGYKSDTFYKLKDTNKVIVPIGCYVTIQEIDAPAQYIMDKTVYSWDTKGKEMKVRRIYNELHPCKIRIKKYDAAGKRVLANVQFRLTFVKQSETYTDNALKTYVPLLKEGESTVAKTDSKGEINWENLDQGEYQITEVQTVNGDTILKDPINVTLPITMTDAEVKTYKADTSKGTFDTDYSKKWFFYNASYEVTNDYTFKLPQTGGMGTWRYGFIGVGIAVVLAGGLFVHDSLNKKRKRKRA